jgi:predicted DNA-binding transcriptional regulator YafY
MAETLARVLQLLGLLQSRPVWSGPELAARLGVTVRSVRRDVERLRELGYPVQASKGVGGGYQLGAGGALPPLLLDPEEAVAVAVCLRLAAGGTVSGVGEAALRTLAKLDQVLPGRLRAQVSAVHEATETLDSRLDQVDPDVLLTLARASRDHQRVRFAYAARGGETTDRPVEPFRPREAPDAREYVSRSVTQGPYRHVVRVRFAAPVAAVAEHVSPSAGTVEALEDGSCLLTAGADHLDHLAVHLVSLGLGFTVVEPAELRSVIRDLAERFARAAADSPAAPLA